MTSEILSEMRFRSVSRRKNVYAELIRIINPVFVIRLEKSTSMFNEIHNATCLLDQ